MVEEPVLPIKNRFRAPLFIGSGVMCVEAHRTHTSYEDSFTIKMIVFQFINFYGSIIYIAFFKGRSLVYVKKNAIFLHLVSGNWPKSDFNLVWLSFFY